MNKKEIALGVIGIILIVFVAFFLANMIHDYNRETINKNKEKKEIFKVDGKKINFKTYRVDQIFFLNIPDIFVMLDEQSLKEKYNYNNRPELVFMSEDDLNHIFISTTNESMTDDLLETYLNNRIASLTTMEILDSGMIKKYNKSFAFLKAKDSNTYYSLKFFTLDDKLVSVEYNAPVNIYNKWDKIMDEVMDSICFREEDIKKY